MSSMLGGGSGGGSIPSPPPFHPINISKISDKALDQDLRRYLSYTFPVFPGMTDVRQKEIEDAYKQLTQPLSPEFSNTFLRNATVAQQGVTGGGNPYSAMGAGKGSFAQGAETASVARQAMAKEDYDRARMEGLIQQNPVPNLGLSQNDLLSMYVYNTGAANAWSMSNYANQIAGANANFAQYQNELNSVGNLVAGLGNTYYNYSLYNQYGG